MVAEIVALASILGLVIILGIVIMWIVSSYIIKPPPHEENHSLSDFDFSAEEITFYGLDGTKLAGWFIAGSNDATVILAHGYARSHQELLPQANVLNKAGYNVFVFDFRARGKSEGKYVTLGAKEPLDIIGAVKYLEKRKEIDKERIGILGVSMGAVGSIIAAAKCEEIKALVLESPFKDIKSIMAHNFKKRSHLPLFPLFYLLMFVIKLRLGINWDDIDVIDSVRKISGRPILFINDLKDERVPLELSMLVYRASGKPEELWMVPDAEHARAIEACPQEYQQRVIGFFSKYLG